MKREAMMGGLALSLLASPDVEADNLKKPAITVDVKPVLAPELIKKDDLIQGESGVTRVLSCPDDSSEPCLGAYYYGGGDQCFVVSLDQTLASDKHKIDLAKSPDLVERYLRETVEELECFVVLRGSN